MILRNETSRLNVCLALLFALAGFSAGAQRLVMRGDYPDPSVVKIGDTYWASATTSNWAPAYPLLKSKDLVNWKTTGHVFNQLPAWADFYFWAPEITYENGRVYIYYSAHKKDGNLCVGVASADKPEGPYRDHGPLICQEVGSIDAFPMRDRDGKLYLIWKEDANSVNKPTPIWIQEINEERTALLGKKRELFRNDAPWEANLVEGVSMLKQGDYYYAFYAAAGCCGAGCTYGTGIARSKSLFGPWEKYPGNPVLTHTQTWRCPGHGTPVEKDGRFYFLYHAYDAKHNIFTGREGLLMEFRFTNDGWVEFLPEGAGTESVPLENFGYSFKGRELGSQWQWSVFGKPEFALKGGELRMGANTKAAGTFLGHKTLSGNYTATVKVNARRSTAAAGLGLIGDENNALIAYYEKGAFRLVQVREGKETELARMASEESKKPQLQLQVSNGKDVQFLCSTDGKTFVPLHPQAIDASFLPPWDRAVRIGLHARGALNNQAYFDAFDVVNR